MRENRAEMRKTVQFALALVAAVVVVATPALAAPVFDGLYVLDGLGNIHTVDNAPVISSGIDFGYDIARSLARTGDETGFVTGLYMLTGTGDVFSFGDAPLYPGVDRPFWGWDIARDVEPAADWTDVKNGQAGFYVLDGYGGIFPVGDFSRPYFKVYRNAQSIDLGEDTYMYFGWDIAKDLEASVTYETPGKPRLNGYYVLDGFGAVHWNIEDNAGDVDVAPWDGQPQPYFGWNIARDFEVTDTAQGYFLLDGYGGLHMVGDADLNFTAASGASVQEMSTPLFGWDIGKSMKLVYNTENLLTGMIVLDGYGGLHELGNVTVQNPLPLFEDGNGDPYNIAKDMALSPFFKFVSDASINAP